MNPEILIRPGCIFNRKGLTLIENMIVLLILTLVLLGTASMQVHSMKINAEAHSAFGNSMVAAEYLEMILGLPFDDPLLGDPDDGYAPEVADHGPFTMASGRGSIEWEVDDRFPVPDAKRVQITIRTRVDAGRRKIYTYEYLKTKGFE
jgi:prepilin-type N-terminal cleavage/methylation domain-containing protein